MKIVVADPNLAPLPAHLEEGFPIGSEVAWPDPRNLSAVEAAVADADVLVSATCPAAVGAAG